jgi:[acyl-carrier-protein] S-malonyltransferase
MAKIAFLFPGQGSQSVGMGKDLYEQVPSAKKVIDQFNEWVHPDLKDVMFNGPEDTLKRTLYTQPAILAVSIAALTVFREQTNIEPAMAAGHSLGEYGALYAAGVIDLETAAKLVKRRAECMENAPPGSMAAILGLPETQVEKAVMHIRNRGEGLVTVANYNTADQLVISGVQSAVEAACQYATEELGASRAIMLQVGGAFHSPLMEEVSKPFREYLQQFSFSDATFPVITNVDAQLTTRGPDFAEKLADQIYSPVRWQDTTRLMIQEGVDTFIEIGPGKVLTGMIRKIYKEATYYQVSDAASLQKTVDALRERIMA